ncbi:MAG: hypothetical protein GQ532_20935 [Methylomarinum sp.]|nr:hypothetical protein [Methylomarinum sp.]
MIIFSLVIGWIVIWFAIILVRYQDEILSSWREPALKYPVLIFESDDWGAGPLIQAQSLQHIIPVLTRYSDIHGHHPVMTIGVILSIPDATKIQSAQYKTYFDKRFDDSIFDEIKNSMLEGVEKGAFDIQLHGMAHYWPENLMRELQTSEKVREWLNHEEFPRTETLLSTLQSRWINTKKLPSVLLSQDQMDKAVEEEVHEFKALFGFNPKVVVPPTFIWTEMVERSWKQCSVNYLVTPGQCFEQRDSEGKPRGNGNKIVNSQQSSTGLTYMVRNDYFEPSLGHTAEMAIKALDKKTNLAQPTLLEMHRFNFIENEETTRYSLKELERVIFLALEKHPEITFLSTKELADKYLSNDIDFIEQSYFIRLLVCINRVWANHAIRKWLYVSGLFIPVYLLKKYHK